MTAGGRRFTYLPVWLSSKRFYRANQLYQPPYVSHCILRHDQWYLSHEGFLEIDSLCYISTLEVNRVDIIIYISIFIVYDFT